MAIFLDSGFYLGLIHKQDEHHERALGWLQKIRSGSYGQVYTSNLVMAETATIMASRTKGNPLAIERTRQLFAGDLQLGTIIRVNEDDEKNAWDLFTKLSKAKDLISAAGLVSFVDCTIIVLCQAHDIAHIASFDGHFKSWLKYP
ncbi:MAG: type II toxin-antitoxin system VapC family toxin [Candidatus Lokiarchaeota archaeon]|nr:type II toxin-antitoxin system VapC family toxin [Candidatus Lokiarchaeota archaeon]